MTDATDQERDAYHNDKMRKKQQAREKIMAGKTVERGLVIVHTGRARARPRRPWAWSAA